MCRICVDFEQGKLTWKEAWQNLRELYDTDREHLTEVWLKLIEKDDYLNEQIKTIKKEMSNKNGQDQ